MEIELKRKLILMLDIMRRRHFWLLVISVLSIVAYFFEGIPISIPGIDSPEIEKAVTIAGVLIGAVVTLLFPERRK